MEKISWFKLVFLFIGMGPLSVWGLSLDEDIPVQIPVGKDVNPVWYVGAFEKDPVRSIPLEGKNAYGGNYSVKQVGSYKGYNLMNISSENCNRTQKKFEIITKKELNPSEKIESAADLEKAIDIKKFGQNSRNLKKVDQPPSNCRGRNFEYKEAKLAYSSQTTTVQMCFYNGVAHGPAFWITREFDGTELARKEMKYRDGLLLSSVESIGGIKVRELSLEPHSTKRLAFYNSKEYTCAPKWTKIKKTWVDEKGKQVLRVEIKKEDESNVALIPIEDVYQQAKQLEESKSGKSVLVPGKQSNGTK